MTTLQIELPEEELAILDSRAHAQGYANGAAYLASVAHHLALEAREFLAEGNPNPEQLAREERLLLEALNDDRPAIEVTPQWWANFRAEMEAKFNGEV